MLQEAELRIELADGKKEDSRRAAAEGYHDDTQTHAA